MLVQGRAARWPDSESTKGIVQGSQTFSQNGWRQVFMFMIMCVFRMCLTMLVKSLEYITYITLCMAPRCSRALAMFFSPAMSSPGNKKKQKPLFIHRFTDGATDKKIITWLGSPEDGDTDVPWAGYTWILDD